MPADPDMLTSWLTHQTNQITEADAIQRLCRVSQRYNDLAAEPDTTVIQAIQGLLSECMTADKVTCFVPTVTGTGLAPYVMIMHCLGPYTTGYGTTSQPISRENIRLPWGMRWCPALPFVTEPTDGLNGPVRLTSMVVPTPDEVHAHYVNQDANTLMNAPAATTKSLSRSSCSCPTAGPLLPGRPDVIQGILHVASAHGDNVRPIQLITTTLAPQPMPDWFGAACVRSGNGNVQCTRSALSIEWGSVLPDRSLLRWAAKRLAPFCLPTPTPPPYPLGLPLFPPDPLAAQALLAERRSFTPQQEKRIIDTASSTQPTDPCPPIYDLMLEEGRTLPRIEAIPWKPSSPSMIPTTPSTPLSPLTSYAM